MAVDPIAALGTMGGPALMQQARLDAISEAAVPKTDTASISLRAPEGPAGGGQGVLSETGERVYNAIDRMGARIPELSSGADAQIVREKQALLPSSDAISPGKGDAKLASGEEGLVNLSKAFDHAVFMASVNQVISGISDTARSLIRQA